MFLRSVVKDKLRKEWILIKLKAGPFYSFKCLPKYIYEYKLIILRRLAIIIFKLVLLVVINSIKQVVVKFRMSLVRIIS